MSFLNTVRNFFTTPDGEYADPQGSYGDYAAEHQPREGRVLNVEQAPKPHRLTIYNPKSFDESEHPATDLKMGTPTIVNFHHLPAHEADRFNAFMQGVVFAINGECTPVTDRTMAYSPAHTALQHKGESQESRQPAAGPTFRNFQAPMTGTMR
ncbi:MAG: cell division protein SepF [bacterium]